MLILAQIPESNLSFPSLEKLHEGGLVSLWRPKLISVGRSGMKWGGGSWFSEARDWSRLLLL